jgi:raffinose/stachyose/melibiose transport system permease protein
VTTVDRPRVRSRRSRRDRIGYLPYLLPGLIAFTVVILIPFGMNIWYSLHKWKGGNAPLRWYGLGNYTDLLADEQFWTSFRNSIARRTTCRRSSRSPSPACCGTGSSTPRPAR